MAVKCGGRGEVRSHGGTVSSLQQQLHCALLGVPFLFQVTDNNTYLALGLGIQKNVREWRNSAYISVLFGWHRQMRPQSGPYSSARAHARWSHNAPRQPADIFHVGKYFSAAVYLISTHPGGRSRRRPRGRSWRRSRSGTGAGSPGRSGRRGTALGTANTEEVRGKAWRQRV